MLMKAHKAKEIALSTSSSTYINIYQYYSKDRNNCEYNSCFFFFFFKIVLYTDFALLDRLNTLGNQVRSIHTINIELFQYYYDYSIVTSISNWVCSESSGIE